MLRRLLVCLDARPESQVVRSAAVRFALGYGSFLTGLFVREAPPPFPMPMADPMVPVFVSPLTEQEHAELVAEHERTQAAAQAVVAGALDEDAGRAGLSHELLVRVGQPAGEIVEGSRTTDLVVMGRGPTTESRLGSVTGWIVRRVARPVLVVAGELRPVRRIAVAYDGSTGADHALALAADLAVRWRDGTPEVHLVAAATGAEARDHLARAERYLEIYGLEHTVHVGEGRAADAIVETAERMDADLLAMGAFGHSRVRDVLLGSVTESVLARWSRPMLLSR